MPRAIECFFEQDLALEGAATILPEAKRTHAAKLKLASRIIAAAAKGERDPVQLQIAALLEIVDDQGEDDLERSYFQLKRLRDNVEQAEVSRVRPQCNALAGSRCRYQRIEVLKERGDKPSASAEAAKYPSDSQSQALSPTGGTTVASHARSACSPAVSYLELIPASAAKGGHPRLRTTRSNVSLLTGSMSRRAKLAAGRPPKASPR
jgi:hypothetical protein